MSHHLKNRSFESGFFLILITDRDIAKQDLNGFSHRDDRDDY